MNRRNFLKVATTTSVLSSLGVSANEGNRHKSVIIVYLAGGISHYELSSPNKDATEPYRSITGINETNIPGIQIGGNYKKLATIADKFSIVRGFGHNDASHGSATHTAITGSERLDKTSDNATPDFPSFGSVASSYFGTNSDGGMPNYVGVGRVYADGPSWLGSNLGPYENSGNAINNLKIRVDKERYNSRKSLSLLIPDINIVTRKGDSKSIDLFESQVYEMLEGGLENKFNIELESPEMREMYGKTSIGNQLLMARRLIENKSRVVLATSFGWDFHSGIKEGHNRLDPEVDRAIYALITDLVDRGLYDDTLIVITSEFGRTKLNNTISTVGGGVGRDHFSSVTSLLFAGGGYNHGRIIGEHDKNATRVISGKSSPKDVNATLFSFLGIPDRLQALDHSGRPRDLLPAGAKSIL